MTGACEHACERPVRDGQVTAVRTRGSDNPQGYLPRRFLAGNDARIL